VRYVALLQRSDDAHARVAEGDSRDEVVAAATSIYSSLIPFILEDSDRHDEWQARTATSESGPDAELAVERQRARDHGWMPSHLLRRLEWGVAVYDTQPFTSARGTLHHSGPLPPELVFWLGATLDDPDV
jgi:hypothetical protein